MNIESFAHLSEALGKPNVDPIVDKSLEKLRLLGKDSVNYTEALSYIEETIVQIGTHGKYKDISELKTTVFYLYTLLEATSPLVNTILEERRVEKDKPKSETEKETKQEQDDRILPPEKFEEILNGMSKLASTEKFGDPESENKVTSEIMNFINRAFPRTSPKEDPTIGPISDAISNMPMAPTTGMGITETDKIVIQIGVPEIDWRNISVPSTPEEPVVNPRDKILHILCQANNDAAGLSLRLSDMVPNKLDGEKLRNMAIFFLDGQQKLGDEIDDVAVLKSLTNRLIVFLADALDKAYQQRLPDVAVDILQNEIERINQIVDYASLIIGVISKGAHKEKETKVNTVPVVSAVAGIKLPENAYTAKLKLETNLANTHASYLLELAKILLIQENGSEAINQIKMARELLLREGLVSLRFLKKEVEEGHIKYGEYVRVALAIYGNLTSTYTLEIYADPELNEFTVEEVTEMQGKMHEYLIKRFWHEFDSIEPKITHLDQEIDVLKKGAGFFTEEERKNSIETREKEMNSLRTIQNDFRILAYTESILTVGTLLLGRTGTSPTIKIYDPDKEDVEQRIITGITTRLQDPVASKIADECYSEINYDLEIKDEESGEKKTVAKKVVVLNKPSVVKLTQRIIVLLSRDIESKINDGGISIEDISILRSAITRCANLNLI